MAKITEASLVVEPNNLKSSIVFVCEMTHEEAIKLKDDNFRDMIGTAWNDALTKLRFEVRANASE